MSETAVPGRWHGRLDAGGLRSLGGSQGPGSHEEELLIPGYADDPVYRALGFPAGAT